MVYTRPITLQKVDLRWGFNIEKSPSHSSFYKMTINKRKKNPCSERHHRTKLEYMVAIHNSAGIRMTEAWQAVCTPNSICWSYWYVDTKYNPFLLSSSMNCTNMVWNNLDPKIYIRVSTQCLDLYNYVVRHTLQNKESFYFLIRTF